MDDRFGILDGFRRHVQQDVESAQDLHQQENSAHGKPSHCSDTKPRDTIPLVVSRNRWKYKNYTEIYEVKLTGNSGQST